MSYVNVIPADIEVEMGGELSEAEVARAEQLVTDAEVIIRTRIADLDRRLLNDNYTKLVEMVIRSAVCRVLRNPKGIKQDDAIAIDNYRVASGYLAILESEWVLLGGSSAGGMFMINPQAGLFGESETPEPYGWDEHGKPLYWTVTR
ncbi:MAG TPA: hypothetical protein VF885_26665 [Arthrobacter sp.]